MALLDQKERFLENIFTQEGRYFLTRGGSEISYFSPKSLSFNSETGKESLSVAPADFYFAELSNARSVPNGTVSDMSPVSNIKKTWARVIEVSSSSGISSLGDFNSSWQPLTELEDYKTGFIDVVRSVISGTFDTLESNWNIGSLISVSGTSISLNGQGREVRNTFKTLNQYTPTDSNSIVKNDLLIQEEFSNYINGLYLPPVIKSMAGNTQPLRKVYPNPFTTNRTDSAKIRNRLLNDKHEYVEVDAKTVNRPVGDFFEYKWIPVERRRFDFKFDTVSYKIEVAQALDCIRFDKNLYFIGKIIPVSMPDRPEITTNCFLRIFTMIFEDGT